MAAPTHVGVSGLSMAASRWAKHPSCPLPWVHVSVRSWWSRMEAGLRGGGLGAVVDAVEFPFAVVGECVRGLGLAGLPAGDRDWFACAADFLAEYVSPAAVGYRPLVPWLTAIGTAGDEVDGGAAVSLLEQLLAPPDGCRLALVGGDVVHGDGDTGPGVPDPWQVCTALAGDLVLVEAAALKYGRPSTAQHDRTAAVLRLIEVLLVLRGVPLEVDPGGDRAAAGCGPRRSQRLLHRVSHLVRQADKAVGEPARKLATVTVLPMTRLHDELLVIRARQLGSVATRLSADDRLAVEAALGQVIATMPASFPDQAAGAVAAMSTERTVPAVVRGREGPGRPGCRCPGRWHEPAVAETGRQPCVAVDGPLRVVGRR